MDEAKVAAALAVAQATDKAHQAALSKLRKALGVTRKQDESQGEYVWMKGDFCLMNLCLETYTLKDILEWAADARGEA